MKMSERTFNILLGLIIVGAVIGILFTGHGH